MQDGSLRCQYWYFCTSQAIKMSTSVQICGDTARESGDLKGPLQELLLALPRRALAQSLFLQLLLFAVPPALPLLILPAFPLLPPFSGPFFPHNLFAHPWRGQRGLTCGEEARILFLTVP